MADMNVQGGYFAPKNYLKVNEGGSHDENPNGGVQIGMDPQGVPNMLEEGEPVYNDFVYSDNIEADEEFLLKHNLPKKYAGWFYSRIADDLFEEYSQNPIDPISKNGADVMLSRLAEAQEEQKQVAEQREMEQMLSELSPEELDALGQQLAMEEQASAEQQAMQEQAMAQQAPEEAMAMQGASGMSPEMMALPGQAPMMACGGPINKFDDGGEGSWLKRLWNTQVNVPIMRGSPTMFATPSALDLYKPENLATTTVGNEVAHALDVLPTGIVPIGTLFDDTINYDETNGNALALDMGLMGLGPLFRTVRGARAAGKAARGVAKAGEKVKAAGKVLDVAADAKNTATKSLDDVVNQINDLSVKMSGAKTVEEVEELSKQMEGLRKDLKAAKKGVVSAAVGSGTAKIGNASASAGNKLARTYSNVVSGVTGFGKPIEAVTSEVSPVIGEQAERAARNNFWRTRGGKWTKGLIGTGVAGAGVLGVNALVNATRDPEGNNYVYPQVQEPVEQIDNTVVAQPSPSDTLTRDANGLTILPKYEPTFRRRAGGPINTYGDGRTLDTVYVTANGKQMPRFSQYATYNSGLNPRPGSPYLIPFSIDDGSEEAMELMAQRDNDFASSYAPPVDNIDVAGIRSRKPQNNMLSTTGRYLAPLLETGIGLYDAFQPADKYDMPRYQAFTPSGNIRLIDPRYNRIDVNQSINNLNNQMNGTIRGLRNSGVGQSTAAAIIAADAQGNVNRGALQAQDKMTNEQLYNNALAGANNNEATRAQFYLGLDRYRQQALAEAQRGNAQRALQLQMLNNQAEGQKWQAVSNQLKPGINALGAIGQENFNMNMVNSNPYFEGYGISPYGYMNYLASAAYEQGKKEEAEASPTTTYAAMIQPTVPSYYDSRYMPDYSQLFAENAEKIRKQSGLLGCGGKIKKSKK